jgi:hypothetical protein
VEGMTAGGPFWVGDVPAQPLVVVPSRRGEDIDLAPFDDIEVLVYGPLGAPIDTSGFLAQKTTDGQVLIEWPGDMIFTETGVYTLVIALLGDEGQRERADSLTAVVQDDDGWHTLESARVAWNDAPEEDTTLWALLESAKAQCIEYAPALTGRPPINYRQAHLIQSRNLWQSVKSDQGGNLTADGFTIPVYSLDWIVKGLLRPKRGTPLVG